MAQKNLTQSRARRLKFFSAIMGQEQEIQKLLGDEFPTARWHCLCAKLLETEDQFCFCIWRLKMEQWFESRMQPFVPWRFDKRCVVCINPH